MKIQKIKFKELNNEYSIFIGNKAINLLSKNLKIVCPKAKKIALLIDTKIPKTRISE